MTCPYDLPHFVCSYGWNTCSFVVCMKGLYLSSLSINIWSNYQSQIRANMMGPLKSGAMCYV